MTKITHIVVHYTATYEDENITAADVDRMHKARGWSGIGYHWFIRRDGTLEPGRPESQVGAHVGGQNTGKLGISWAGGLNRKTGPEVGVNNITKAQEATLIKQIKEMLKRYPAAQVVGHRDLAATQCPGFDVRTWWAGVNKTKAPAPVAVPPEAPVKTPNVGEDKVHIVVKGDTWWSISKAHGLELAQLQTHNKASSDTPLRVGQQIKLDVPSVPPIAPPVTQPKTPVELTPPKTGLMALAAMIAAAVAAYFGYGGQ
jgi:N-acetylmuramoyl-L-alanine amidase